MIFPGRRVIANEDHSGDDLTIDLRAVLVFVTGADHPPPMGFPNSPEILFETSKNRSLPTACTCGPSLYLPLVLKDPDYFREKMDFAICCAHGFGNP